MDGQWSLQGILAPVLLLVVLTRPVLLQGTLGESGCSFFDDKNSFHIELTRGAHGNPCTSVDALRDEFELTRARTQDALADMMLLQRTLLRLQEQNDNLTRQLRKLEQQLQATNDALKLDIASTDCPHGYVLKSDQFKSCYMFVSRHLNWYNAQVYCSSTGGHLVALETEEEQQFIINYIIKDQNLPGQHIWTGGNDIGQEGLWMWAGLHRPFNTSQWLLYNHESEGTIQMPDNDENDEHCVHLFHSQDYQWNDQFCGNKFYSICEYKIL